MQVKVVDYEEFSDVFNCEVTDDAGAVHKIQLDAGTVADLCPNTELLDDLPYDLCGEVFQADVSKYIK